jgi:hypothetical protein
MLIFSVPEVVKVDGTRVFPLLDGFEVGYGFG